MVDGVCVSCAIAGERKFRQQEGEKLGTHSKSAGKFARSIKAAIGLPAAPHRPHEQSELRCDHAKEVSVLVPVDLPPGDVRDSL